jgi:hypothetical protein
MAVLRALVVAVLLVLGAAGLSSLEGDDYCSENYPAGFGAGSSYSASYALWPLGPTCEYTGPGARTATVKVGEPIGFFGALIVGGVVWWWREQFRTAWAATLVFAVAGVGSVVAGWLLAFLAGFAIGVPLAMYATRSVWRGLVAAGALVCAGALWLLGAGLLAFAIPLLVLVLFGGPRRAAATRPG